ncbi:MAG: hypothetical protein IJ161_12165 [Bacteroidales bacterium]|nr:hypothetical protein [Bacteroidales bacterium]
MESSGKVFSEDIVVLVNQLLKRVEVLEAEVASLKGVSAPVDEESLDPIDLDFGDDIVSASGATVVEAVLPEKEPVAEEEETEEVTEEPVLTETESAPVEIDLSGEEVPEESPVELSVPDSSDEDMPSEVEPAPVSEDAEPVEEAIPAEEPESIEEVIDIPEEEPVREEIPMEDLPEDIDDLPFDLPEDDAPYEGDAAPVPSEDIPSEKEETSPAKESVTESEPVAPAEEIIEEEVAEEEDAPLNEEDLPSEEKSVSEDLPEEHAPVEPEAEPVPEEEPDTLMDLFGDVIEPVAPVKRGRPKKEPKSINDAAIPQESVMDALYVDSAWRKDMPGPEVRNVRSAISMNDRILFVNRLFRKDFKLYDDIIEKINNMGSLDEVVSLIDSTFPEWKMDSEDVYRFMMAVRRKIRS